MQRVTAVLLSLILVILTLPEVTWAQYPTSSATFPTFKEASSGYLTSTMSSVEMGVVNISGASTWPGGVGDTYVLQVGSELIVAHTVGSSEAFNIDVRGAGGTTAAAHPKLALVKPVWSSYSWDIARTTLNGLQTKLGIGADYPGVLKEFLCVTNPGGVGTMWGSLTACGVTLADLTGGSATQGDMLYASAANTWSKLAKDANATRYLSNTGASNNPAWAQVDVTNGITGIVPSANGGTGINNAGRTLTVNTNSGTIAFPGAATTMTFPSTTATIARTDAGQTFTGVNTFTAPVLNSTVTGTGVSQIVSASTLAQRDANNNLTAGNFIPGYTTIVTANGTSTLTAASSGTIFLTGGTSQNVDLPVTSTLTLGHRYEIWNDSTGAVTVRSSGANTVQVMGVGSRLTVTCILTSGTTAASWSVNYTAGWIKFQGPATSQKTFTLPNASANILTDNTAVTAAQGGTGQTGYAVGDLLYASGLTTLSKLNGVATGNALISGGVSTAPSWGKIGLTTHVSGILPIANGGTNASSFTTTNGATYYDGTRLVTSPGILFAGTPQTRIISSSTTTDSPTLGTASGTFASLSNNGLYGLYIGSQTSTGHTWMQGMRNDSATAYPIVLQPAGGNVGIGGVASINYPLTIYKNGLNESGNLYNILRASDATGNKGVDLGYDNSSQTGTIAARTNATASNLAFWTWSGSAWGERARIASNGTFSFFPVGGSAATNIGVLSDNTTYGVVTLNSVMTNAGHLGMAGGSTGDGNLYINAVTDMQFRTGSSTIAKATLKSDGKFGVGVSPAHPIDFAFTNTDGSTGGLQLKNLGTNATFSYAGFTASAQNGAVIGDVTAVPTSGTVLSGGGLMIRTQTNHPISMQVNSAEKLRLSSTGVAVTGTFNGAQYYHVTLTIAPSTTKVLTIAYPTTGAGIIANHTANVACYSTSGSGSCLLSWTAGGLFDAGTTAYNHVGSLVSQTSGNPVLGAVTKTNQGSSVSIQNTSGIHTMTVMISVMSYGGTVTVTMV